MTAILFCCEPFTPHRPDPDFEEEWQAARDCGFTTRLFSWEDAKAGNWGESLQKIPRSDEPTELLYRGWMLESEVYAELYARLESRGWRLVNTPEQYTSCHHFPPCYSLIEGHTPAGVWVSADAPWEEQYRALQSLSSESAIVKDYVKSRKHEWLEACYMPDTKDEAACRRVVDNFVERQGDSLQGGLVFREFAQLESAGNHPLSGMPLSREYRRFVYKGQSLGDEPYWEGVPDTAPSWPWLDQLAQNVPSNFFTVDWAISADGTPLIVELGDAQVAGRPPAMTPTRLFTLLQNCGTDSPSDG